MTAKREPRNSPEVMERIKVLVGQRRHNPSSFALALGYSRQWGYAFMENRILMSAGLLVKIARLLGVSTDFLLTGEDANCEASVKTMMREVAREVYREEQEKKIKSDQ